LELILWRSTSSSSFNGKDGTLGDDIESKDGPAFGTTPQPAPPRLVSWFDTWEPPERVSLDLLQHWESTKNKALKQSKSILSQEALVSGVSHTPGAALTDSPANNLKKWYADEALAVEAPTKNRKKRDVVVETHSNEHQHMCSICGKSFGKKTSAQPPYEKA
jgi:hypothetical protein